MTANTATGNKMFDNAYTYDRIGNILSLTNDAVATGPNPIGGKYGHGYTYDLFNRLTTANSYWEYEEGNQDLYTNELTLGYGDMHRISYKNQEQLRDGNIVPEHSYFKDYAYTTGRNHIQQITNNGEPSGIYKYDLNGNMRNITEPDLPVSTRYFAWDEANRLKAVRKADALVQHHLYDANGERSHKGISNLFYMGINGGPQGYDHYIGNYQLYPSGYLTVGEYDLVTKHYYTGTQRIASRLAGDVTEFHAAGESGEYGHQTLGLKDRQEDDIKAAFDQLKLSAPAIWNVPGMVPPCNQGEEEDELCACVFQHQCGTGPIYFFHSDHLGSSTFLTDGSGQPYQFFLNLPFGETMEEQFALSPNVWWKTPYLFNGKELDARTSLYYYGARYYDPGLSVWLSVDPLAEDYAKYTPYNFVMQNPIRLLDPDGMGVKSADDIIVGDQVWTPGAQWVGDENDFGAKAFTALNDLYKNIEAGNVSIKEHTGNVIMDFVGADKPTVSIVEQAPGKGSESSPSGSQILWNPGDDIMIGPSDDGMNVPGILSSTTQLAHEFGHKWLNSFAPNTKKRFERIESFTTGDKEATHNSFILPMVENKFSRARGEGVRANYRGIYPNKEIYLEKTGLTGYGDYYLNNNK